MNISSLLALVLSLTVVSPALAQEAFRIPATPHESFSDKARTLVAGSISGHYVSDNGGSGANWSVALSPSAAYFVRDRIGLGIAPGFVRGKDSAGLDYREATLGVYGIFDVPLARRVSLLVIPTLAYAYRKQTVRAFDILTPILGSPEMGLPAGIRNTSFTSSQHSLRLTVHLPFVYHASSSIVLGLGPFFAYNRLVSDASSGPLGGSLSVGGASPFSPIRNTFHIGVSSFIGASF